MKRYTEDVMDGLIQAIDGEWIRYADHVEAMKRIAGAPVANALTAKQRYDEFMEPGEEPSAVERLRFFCSLAMSGQDWLDVEPFFDAILAAPPEQAAASPAAQWEDHRVQKVYEILCRDDAPPPGEHWEGFQARLIVDAICGASPAPSASAQQALESLCQWLLHRFGPDSQEGNEASSRLAAPAPSASPSDLFAGNAAFNLGYAKGHEDARTASPAALTVALREALLAEICEHTDSSRTWAEGIVNNAVRKTRFLVTEPLQGTQEPVAYRCESKFGVLDFVGAGKHHYYENSGWSVMPLYTSKGTSDARALRWAASVIQLYDDATTQADYMIDANDAEQILLALAGYVERFAAPAPTQGTQEPCPHCHGDGVDGEPGDEPGTGYTWKCEDCNGTGRAQYRTVPVNPTPEMVDAAYSHPEKMPAAAKKSMADCIRRAILAAPAPVASPEKP